MSDTADNSLFHHNGTEIENEFVTPQIDDEWEKMYLDIDDNESRRSAPQIDDEGKKMFLDIDDNESRQDIDSYTDDDNNLNDLTWSHADKQCDNYDGMYFSDNQEDNPSYSPIPKVDDDWENMYLDGNGMFIDDDNNNDDAMDVNDFFGNDSDPFDAVDSEAYLEDLVDGHEDDQDIVDELATVENEEINQDSHLLQSETGLSGRRIVDINYLFKQIQSTGKHTDDCHFEDMVLEREIKNGLSSIFVFKCGVCGITTRIETDQKKRTTLGINADAVLGITCIGSGFSHIEELSANLNVPSMSYSLFRKEEKLQQEDWFKLAKKECLSALLEEIELAKANGQVDSKGNVLLRIITDGSWGKRSYGRFFSSLSGCAVIIGLRTNKVIFFDVRNKYCHTCKLAEGKGITVKKHKCNKNYSGPSTGMESDIIIQGFKECDVFGARFNVLISDGDSNTYKLIRDLRIYKDPDVFVAKLECVNHLYRNYYKKFNNLSGITKFNSDYRKELICQRLCMKICKGVRSATQHWCKTDDTPSMKERMLENDILNVLPHYLGYHEKCNGYFCTRTTLPNAAANIQLLKDDGLYYEIQSILQSSFGNNVKSLLLGYTNNPAEQLNGYVAKYLGGKRINYSLAGSYTSRVAMAVVHFNSGCHASSEYRKMKFGGISDIPAVENLEEKRKRKCVQTAVIKAKKPRIRGTKNEQGETAYGGDYSEDMEPRALEIAKNIIMEKLERNQMNRTSIENISKDDEHFYHEKARNMLMSHYFSNVINSKGPKFYTKILDEVMYIQSELGNNAQNRHQRVQEHEALQRFKQIYPTSSVQECGLVIDEELPFLGTSPFKLVGDDHILTIKCPLKAYQKVIEDTKMQFWTTKSGQRTINKKSAWYIELQGELHITKRKWAYLFIWLDEGQHQLVEVKRDDAFFMNEMKEKLCFFYKEGMLKELANSRKERQMELRTYDESSKTFI